MAKQLISAFYFPVANFCLSSSGLGFWVGRLAPMIGKNAFESIHIGCSICCYIYTSMALEHFSFYSFIDLGISQNLIGYLLEQVAGK